MCDLTDALLVLLCAGLWCYALSCSFRLWFRICSTSWADLGQFLLRNIQYIYNTKSNICIKSWLWQHHWQSHSGITQSTQVTKIKLRDQLPLWVSEHYLNWSRAKVYFPDAGSLPPSQPCDRAISSADSHPMLAKTLISFSTMHPTNGLLMNMQTKCLISCTGILTVGCYWNSLLGRPGCLQDYIRHLKQRKCMKQQKYTVI